MLSDDLIKPYEKRIQRFIEKEVRRFELNQPCKCSVKKRDGTFRMEAFIGGEPIQPTAIYFGKKEQAIFVFKPINPSNFAFLEIPLVRARELIDGFDTFLEEAMNVDLEDLMIAAEKESFQRNEMARVVSNPSYEQLYGSW